jgi:hypothetical protein
LLPKGRLQFEAPQICSTKGYREMSTSLN